MVPSLEKDTLRFDKGKLKVRVVIFTGKEGDYFVTISPSLNVSGYGKTKQESQDSFHENVMVFCEDLTSLPKTQIEEELRNLGFKQERFHHKNFSKIYVDENGTLQNFEAGTLERHVHEVSTCA